MSLKLKTRAALIAVVALGACAKGGGVAIAPVVGLSDNRPEGRRYVDYLISDGGLEEISLDIQKRSSAAGAGAPLSFLGQLSFDPYNAPVLNDSPVRRELRSLTSCLIDAWPGPKPEVNIIVNSGLAPSGQALPNEISINLGLIAAEDVSGGEVAFVLAHELAHVLLDHYERAEFLNQQKEIAEHMAQAATLAVYASELRARRSSSGGFEFFVKDEGQVAEAAVYTLAAYSASQIVADGIIESSWSRTQEFESDRLALDLMQNAGLSDQFGYQALRRIAAFQAGQKGRLDRLDDAAGKQMEAAVATGDANMIIRAGADVFTKAAVSAVLDVYDEINSTHPTAEEREGEIDGYLEEFEDGPRPEALTACNFDRLDRAMGARRVRNVYNAISSAAEVDDLLLNGDINGARRAAEKGFSAGLRRHPVTRMAAFRVENAAGRPTQALAHLEQIRRSQDTPLAVHTTIAGEYLVRGRYRQASRALDTGEKYFRKDFFYPKRLQLAIAREDLEDIARYRAACKATTIEPIQSACDDVLSNREVATKNAVLGGEATPTGAFGGFLESLQDAASSLTE
ncbi:MAG: M48 family metalloprotease [Pseudomonadota bacterium]